jgi:hypothetical protein
LRCTNLLVHANTRTSGTRLNPAGCVAAAFGTATCPTLSPFPPLSSPILPAARHAWCLFNNPNNPGLLADLETAVKAVPDTTRSIEEHPCKSPTSPPPQPCLSTSRTKEKSLLKMCKVGFQPSESGCAAVITNFMLHASRLLILTSRHFLGPNPRFICVRRTNAYLTTNHLDRTTLEYMHAWLLPNR